MVTSVVSDRVKQLSRTCYERGFRFIYAFRQLIQVRLENRSLVKVFPRFRSMSAAAIYFHNKFDIFHSLSLLLFSAEKRFCERPEIHFSTIWVTLTAVRDLPHSKQHAFNRDVINPQDGHILCDPYPAIFGSLRVLKNSEIVSNAISRPIEILIGLISVLPFGNVRIECSASDADGAFAFTAFHVLIAIQPPQEFSRRPSLDAIVVVLRFAFVGATVLRGQGKHVAAVGVSLCAAVRGHVNLGYPLVQHRHVYVLSSIQDISASLDPTNAIGAAHAGFRGKRKHFQGKKLSFGSLHPITDPNPAKLERWGNEIRRQSGQWKIGYLAT